jgi:adenylate cyclase
LSSPRHLAVVLFADIVGYTHIVSEDEARARSTRAALNAVLHDVLGARGGTLVQSFGDGTLCVFSSAVEAALAASELQIRFSGATGADLRVGLHLGEISWDADGAYGDAVNTAARLQTIATPGSVLISEEVARQLKSRPDIPRSELGQVRLKNVDDPVRVYALTLAGLHQPGLAEVASRARESGGGGATEHEMMPRSLAVLPVANF